MNLTINTIAHQACSLSQSGSARLAGFNSSYVGFVQVCKRGYWAAISYQEEQEWTRKNSIVACRELGFQGYSAKMGKSVSVMNANISAVRDNGFVAIEISSCSVPW